MTILSTTELYRLRILEGDVDGIVIDGVVKVRYIRYGKDFDERKKQEDNVNFECEDSSAEKRRHFVPASVAYSFKVLLVQGTCV